MARAPRCRLAACAVDRPHGPAGIYMVRRLRALAAQYLSRCTSWRHPPFPRRRCEPPSRIPCVQTARPCGTISSHHPCSVSPPGCLRTRLEIPTSGWQVDARRLPLMWVENRACFGGYCMLISSIAGEQPQLCRSAHGDPSNRSLRSRGRHSDGNTTAPPDSAAVPVVFLSCCVFATLTRLCSCAGLSYPSHSTSQLPQSHGSEIHDANETRPCSFTLAQVAYWYEPAVCATTSIKP